MAVWPPAALYGVLLRPVHRVWRHPQVQLSNMWLPNSIYQHVGRLWLVAPAGRMSRSHPADRASQCPELVQKFERRINTITLGNLGEHSEQQAQSAVSVGTIVFDMICITFGGMLRRCGRPQRRLFEYDLPACPSCVVWSGWLPAC